MITATIRPGRAGLRDPRPRCLTRPSPRSPLSTSSPASPRRSWRSSPASCGGASSGGARCSGARATRPRAWLVVDGRVSISLQLPGDAHGRGHARRPGRGDGRDAAARRRRRLATAPPWPSRRRCCRSAARTSRRWSRAGHPTAFALKRRIAGVGCARLRRQLAALAESLGGEPAGARGPRRRRELEFRGPPDSRYVRRLATFRAFDSLALWGFLTAGRYARCPAGPHAGRRGRRVARLLPDDQRRGREGDRARRPPDPGRARRPRPGVRVREPDRRRPVAGDRDHARAHAPARAAAGRVRAALRRREPGRTCSST